jgi:hypothetical protein
MRRTYRADKRAPRPRRRPSAPLRPFTLTGIPVPVEQCDGTWRVPMWSPDRGWEAGTFGGDSPRQPLRRRADCPDAECDALHQEEADKWDRDRAAGKSPEECARAAIARDAARRAVA